MRSAAKLPVGICFERLRIDWLHYPLEQVAAGNSSWDQLPTSWPTNRNACLAWQIYRPAPYSRQLSNWRNEFVCHTTRSQALNCIFQRGETLFWGCVCIDRRQNELTCLACKATQRTLKGYLFVTTSCWLRQLPKQQRWQASRVGQLKGTETCVKFW